MVVRYTISCLIPSRLPHCFELLLTASTLGIYFTSHVLSTIPYLLPVNNPSILISWVLPGNTYPVIELPTSNDTLVGAGTLLPLHPFNQARFSPPPAPPSQPGHYFSDVLIAMKNGYNAHYVLTTQDQTLVDAPTTEKNYNQLVIGQESQIVPAFIVEFEPLPKSLARAWKKA